MFLFVGACFTMFLLSIAVFVAYDKKAFDIEDGQSLLLALVTAAALSVMWIVTIPALVIIGGAWLVSRLFKLNWKTKNEPNSNV